MISLEEILDSENTEEAFTKFLLSYYKEQEHLSNYLNEVMNRDINYYKR